MLPTTCRRTNVRGRYILYEEAVACIRYQRHI
nr:MAG TPA: hypothetical protein [Caudoviricetes sp.]